VRYLRFGWRLVSTQWALLQIARNNFEAIFLANWDLTGSLPLSYCVFVDFELLSGK